MARSRITPVFGILSDYAEVSVNRVKDHVRAHRRAVRPARRRSLAACAHIRRRHQRHLSHGGGDFLVLFARTLISEAFGGRDPELAQFDLPGPEYAAIVEALEPRFRYHPDTRRLVQQLLVERGCDPETTYFDAPRLRISTSDDYLATGLALTCQPHRDTWYSAPLAQLNYWMPVYDVSEDNALALHPEYFNQAIANGSEEYDHLVWHAQDSGDARTLPDRPRR